MPKDKAATHKRLYNCMRDEFLEKGYEGASLNHIARMAGITPAAVYRHYPSKAEMFAEIVRPAADTINTYFDNFVYGMSHELDTQQQFDEFSPFGSDWFQDVIDIFYQYFDEFHLLVCGSRGSPYEGFTERFIEREEWATKEMLTHMDSAGIPHNSVTDRQIHIAATAYITALFEMIRHNVPKEQAMQDFRFVYLFFSAAWSELLGIGQKE